jgi:hypothetical protein
MLRSVAEPFVNPNVPEYWTDAQNIYSTLGSLFLNERMKFHGWIVVDARG